MEARQSVQRDSTTPVRCKHVYNMMKRIHLSVWMLIFSMVCLVSLYFEYYIIVVKYTHSVNLSITLSNILFWYCFAQISLSIVFTATIILFKLQITADDFTKLSHVNTDNSSPSNPNGQQQPQRSNLDINRLSNIDRLRLLLATSLNANDFSLLGRLDQDNNEAMIKGMTMSQIMEIQNF